MGTINEKFIEFLNSIVGNDSDKLITQAELAEKINCTPVSLSRYLNKKREIPVETLFKIKKVLNISDEMFMKFYNDDSVDKSNNEMYAELHARYIKLSDENKVKLFDYIDYLFFQQLIDDRQKKKVNKNI